MQSRGLEIVVGLFICLGIAAVFLLTFRVSNFADAGSMEGYTVTASFTNIGGLGKGAPVNMAGVRIGRVTGIRVDERTYEAVVSMKIGSQYEIPRDSDAAIQTSGLLGSQYIGVGPGASDKYLEDGDSFQITQSAIILEDIIGQVLYSLTSQGESGGNN